MKIRVTTAISRSLLVTGLVMLFVATNWAAAAGRKDGSLFASQLFAPLADADLELTKSASPDPVSVGEILEYSITVYNHGPNRADNVVVTDTLPPEVTYLSANFGCTLQGDLVCDLNNIRPNRDRTLVISVMVNSEGSGSISNTASASTDDTDNNPANDSDTILTQVIRTADLAISKSAAPDPVSEGQMLQYTVTVDNNGPSPATNVSLTDILPPEVSFISASAGCINTGNVVCTLGSIASGASKSVNIFVTVNPGVTGTNITNQADVSSSTTDPSQGNNHVEINTWAAGSADLAIAKIDSPDPVIAGELLNYTINVQNLGPDDATNVEVVDTLPAEVSLVSASAGCVLQNVLTCAVGSLSAGASKVINISVTVDPAAPLVITNQAEVSSAEADANPANNLVLENTTINNQADLTIDNYVSSGLVVAGNPIEYTMVITNFGPSMAREVTINTSILPEFTFISSPDCILNGANISCNMGELNADQSKTTTAVVSIDPSTTGNVTAVSTVFSSAQDLFPSNNSSITVDQIVSTSDLSVTKTASSNTIVAGTSVTYTITVDNHGPSGASHVEISDLLPEGLTLVSSSVSQGLGCGSSNPVICNLGDIALDQFATATLVVDVAPTVIDTVVNSVNVQSLSIDPNSNNDQDTLQTPVGNSANLNIQKFDDQDPVIAGTGLEYTIVVGNAGPSDASDVGVTDILPGGVGLKSVTNNAGGSCGGTSTVTCNFENLSVGEAVTIKIMVDVDPAQSSALNNTATVVSAADDPDQEDNTADETTDVEAEVDLTLDISTDPNPAIAGQNLIYTLLVTNKGPSRASNVQVTTTLPPDVELESTQTSQGSGCSGDPIVTCQLGRIGPLSDAYAILTTEVFTDHDGLIETSAAVSSAQTDLIPSDNEATENTLVFDKSFEVILPTILNGTPTGEPNDTCGQAYRISINSTHQFFPEDKDDWYVFTLPTNGELVIELSNFEPIHGQIALFKGQECSSSVFIKNNGNDGTTKIIDAGQQTAGQYFIFVGNDGPLNNKDRYDLRVIFSP